tara:strand:+ start:45 stop:2786 length:2742 start_codon:yes stop_codon:yes gene_type:complete
MSIKTIDKQIKGSEGLAKKINKGAERMVFDILQSTQYSTPIPSTIRELATNACDSQREKEIAVEILRGKAKAEDYYITRNGEQYDDSNFDIGYYDLEYLDVHVNHIDIVYKENEGTGYCDTVSVTDYGVGIGARRLEGVLELGYSTKRNTAENFGAFGLGAKVALSTGVDFYTIDTVHNGRRFKMNCYNYKTDFIVSAFNPKLGQPNPHIILSDGTKVFYEEADVRNQTTISFGVKRHNRREYRDAVEEQLLYFDNVKFTRIDSTDYSRETDFKPEVLYNSDNLIISDTYVFSKPHIVLTKDKGGTSGINYGFIDFRELEMEQMWGPIGFKCPARQVITDDDGKEIVLQEGVDVTPSREKVIWNESTKKYILSVIEAAAKEATDIVQENLQQEDFVSWILACQEVLSKADSGSALGRIANIIDKDSLKPAFAPDPRIKNGSVGKLFEKLSVTHIEKVRDYKSGKDEVKRQDATSYAGFRENSIFLKTDENFNRIKDIYLNQGMGGAIIVISKPKAEMPEKVLNMPPGDYKDQAVAMHNKIIAKRNRVWELLKESDYTKSYDNVIVDPEWLADYKQESTAAEELAKFDTLSPEERRKIEERMVAYSFRHNQNYWRDPSNRKRYILDKIEPKVKDLMKTERTTYYGTKADEEALIAACGVLHDYAPKVKHVYKELSYWWKEADSPVYFFDTPPVSHRGHDGKWPEWSMPGTDAINLDFDTPQLIRVSQSNVKHITMNSNVKHISEFFLQLTDNGGYTMDEYAIKWYTAQKVRPILNKTYLYCLKDINQDLFDKYTKVYNACQMITTSDWVKSTEVFSAMDKLMQFQEFVESTDDANAIKNKSRELFVLDMPESVAQDKEVIDAFNELEEFTEGVHVMLSSISEIQYAPDVDYVNLDVKLIKEIMVYLESKDRLNW